MSILALAIHETSFTSQCGPSARAFADLLHGTDARSETVLFPLPHFSSPGLYVMDRSEISNKVGCGQPTEEKIMLAGLGFLHFREGSDSTANRLKCDSTCCS